jgi:hypothetical protein
MLHINIPSLGTRLNILFWSIALVDAALFLGLIATYAAIPGATTSGGKEMGIFFFGVVPLVVLALTALLFHYGRSPLWKYAALAVVLGPGLLYAQVQIRGTLIDYRVRENQLGRGYFKEPALKQLGAAVVRGDLPLIGRLSPGVALDTVGTGGMTLIELAAEQVPQDELSSARVRAKVALVEELLRLGAKPNPALGRALRTNDAGLLQALLAHGANPDAPAEDSGPAVFQWLSVMPAGHLTLLINRGLDVNITQYGASLALTSALSRRYDLVLILARAGADLRQSRNDGRTIASEIASRRAGALTDHPELPTELAAIEKILTAQMQATP